MFRILFYLVVVFVLGLGFAWLAERPGDLAITFSGYRYEVSLMVAAVGIVAIVAAVMILWWLIRSIWTSPYTVARYFRVRRRDRGYQALSTGMIAAGAGDGGLARRMSQQAAKLISADQEPLIHLLDAQAALLDGDRQAARDKFTAMLDDPEMRLLGLRGLYLEAERLGEDIGALDVLQRYERWRRFDTVQMGVTTDVLNRLFSNDNPVLRLVRSQGMGIVNRIDPLRTFFMKQAGADLGELPSLMAK